MKYLFVACAVVAFASSAVARERNEPAEAADLLFGSMARDRPGAVVLVTRGEEAIYSRAFGGADLEQGTPITPDTRFHVASVSKQFTALAIALLVRDGRISLNEDIRAYLPEQTDFGKPITVAQLLNHTSGLRDQWDLFQLSGTDMQSYLSQDAILSLLQKQQSLNFAPGAEYRYSNSGYSLAAEIVARTSGMPFRRFVHERIFTPLRMINSLIYDDGAEMVSGRAQSYSTNAAGAVRLSRLNYSNYGATSMMTTAADLNKWSRELLNPRVFEPSLVRNLYEPTRLTDGTVSNYGLGMYRTKIRGRDAVLHGGSDAGFRSLFASYPQDGLSIIILSNGSAALAPLHEGLVDVFLNDGAAPTAIVQPTPEQLMSLVGYYASNWGAGFEFQVEGGRLVRTAGGPPSAAIFKADGAIEFPPSSARLYFSDAEPGQVNALEERPDSGPPVRYNRIDKRPVSVPELQALAGRYRSEELDITYTLTMTGDRLTIANLQSPKPIPLKAINRDWLDSQGARLTVTRGRDDRPTGLLVTTGRVRALRLDRLE